MARTELTVQQMTRAGLAATFTAGDATNGHQFKNDGYTFLWVVATTNATVVTVIHPGTVDGLGVADQTVSLGTNSEKLIGPFPARFNQGSTNYVYVDLSVDTGVTLAAITIRQ